ncbi:MAG: YraN family protein [Nocardioidaceae bacterium]
MAATAQARIAVGRLGEDVAARYLVEAGMVILDRNWRCGIGEIDIVARSSDALVVVEVKTRTTEMFGSPVEGVTPRKAARLRRLTASWLAEHPIRPPQVRIDVVGVLIPHRGAPVVDHRSGVA